MDLEDAKQKAKSRRSYTAYLNGGVKMICRFYFGPVIKVDQSSRIGIRNNANGLRPGCVGLFLDPI